MTPHLIIRGTVKAGKSSVYQYLAAHPASRSSRTALVVLFSLLATVVTLSVATPPALAADFGCTVTTGESDVRFTFSGGDVGRAANLRISTRWVANVTGETSLVVADGVGETYHVVLNGLCLLYTSPSPRDS